MFDVLPKDPMLCLSVINTKLRDYYKTIDELCQDMNLDREMLEEKLRSIDYEYDAGRNQFVQRGTNMKDMEKYYNVNLIEKNKGFFIIDCQNR